MTPLRCVAASRKSAALRVGVVTDSARPKERAAAFHARPMAHGQMNLGMSVCSSMFSGMKWLVPMIRMPRLRAWFERPRPMMMCDWK